MFWSASCGTNWAQVTRQGRFFNTAWLEGADHACIGDTKDELVSRLMWSNMWYAPNTRMRACVLYTWCTGDCDDPGTLVCTDLR